jgi:hypothetical protein
VYDASKGKLPAAPTATISSPTPSTRGFFGYNLGVSSNKSSKGGVVVIGAYVTTLGTTSDVGAAYLFDETKPTSWKLAKGGTLHDPGNGADDFFGAVVAINGAGTVAMVSAQDETEKTVSDAGAVFTYRRKAGGGWGASQTLVGPSNGSANFAYPAISSNGDVALTAAPSATVDAHAGAGEAFLYAVGSSSFSLQQSVPDPSGGSASSPEYFGNAMAIDATGNACVVAAPAAGGTGGTNGPGEVYIFSIS